MKAIAIIPARLAATRFPRKPLAVMHGIPMLGHCYFRVKMCSLLRYTFVATCDQELVDYVASIGGTAVMTSIAHSRASDRTAEAMLKIESEIGQIDIVVMVQGDEPLVTPVMLEQVLQPFENLSVDIVNLMTQARSQSVFEDRNNVKVVVNQRKDALYFSREAIPSTWNGFNNAPRYLQTGIIAFRRAALLKFNQSPESDLEQLESVDLNRVLEYGGRIRMVSTEAQTIGVDTPEELDIVAELMTTDPLFGQY